MLLGIALHALTSFVALPLPIWPAQDINQHDGYLFALHAIHGFRLQLFFLVSGFFTMMLYQQRGLRGLIRQRAKRIMLPLVVFTIILTPIIMGIGYYALTAEKTRADTLWAAAQSGNAEAVGHHLANGADPNQPDAAGLTALSWAALLGQVDAAAMLIEGGADIHAADSDGYTALHNAAFMGEANMVRLLIENGADIHSKSENGDTPLSVTKTDEDITRFLAAMLQLPLDMKKLSAGRGAPTTDVLVIEIIFLGILPHPPHGGVAVIDLIRPLALVGEAIINRSDGKPMRRHPGPAPAAVLIPVFPAAAVHTHNHRHRLLGRLGPIQIQLQRNPVRCGVLDILQHLHRGRQLELRPLFLGRAKTIGWQSSFRLRHRHPGSPKMRHRSW